MSHSSPRLLLNVNRLYSSTNLDEVFSLCSLLMIFMYSYLTCYISQDIRGSKWEHHPKCKMFISIPILIVLFSFNTLWNFLLAFVKKNWHMARIISDKSTQSGTKRDPNGYFCNVKSNLCVVFMLRIRYNTWAYNFSVCLYVCSSVCSSVLLHFVNATSLRSLVW